MKLTGNQKAQLRRIGAQHATLHDQALGLSRGMSDRRGGRKGEVERELRDAKRQHDEAAQYLKESRDERFEREQMPVVRERLEDAERAVAELDAEVAAMQEQYDTLSVDVAQSGRLLDRLLKFADADQAEPPKPRVEIPPGLGEIGKRLGGSDAPRVPRELAIGEEIAAIERATGGL